MSKKHQAQKQLHWVEPHSSQATGRAIKGKKPKGRYLLEESLTEAKKIKWDFDFLEEDARELVRKHRPFLEDPDSNIVWLSVGPKEVKGMKTNRLALIFGVVKKKGISELSNQSRIIPKEVPLERKEDGKTTLIPTDVVQTGRLIFNNVEGGSAICVETGNNIPSLPICTVGAILPCMFGDDSKATIKTGKKKLQLITSAHLINYEAEKYIGRQLRCLERDRFVALMGSGQIINEFYNGPDQALFSVNGICPVTKWRNTGDEIVYNEFDILYADVLVPEKVSETVLGEVHGGIGRASKDQEFRLAGIASGEHRSTITDFPVADLVVEGEDSEGKYSMYWENMIKYDLPIRPGDSGAALISETDRKIIGLHTFGSGVGSMGFACQVPTIN